MWQQNYYPVAENLGLSALVAALPLLFLFYLLGVRRTPSWKAALAALGTAWVVVMLVIRMPVVLLISKTKLSQNVMHAPLDTASSLRFH